MKESALKLQDKTVFLVGPFSGTTQAILRSLTEFGADVAFVGEQAASRYIDGVNEAREVHAHYGRAVHINMPLQEERQIHDALSGVVQSVGRMDALIDATPLTWSAKTDPRAASSLCLNLAEKIIPFMLAKQRGRIVYLAEDPALDSLQPDSVGLAGREALNTLVSELAGKYRGQNVCVNALSIGVTDDYLLRHFPKSPSLKRSFEELRAKAPTVKLVDTNDIGLSAAFLISALCAPLTGQTLRLTHGFHLATGGAGAAPVSSAG